MAKSKIYTKTGDHGTTSLVGGSRVAKTHDRLEAYGTIDELNSFVGFLSCIISQNSDLETLSFIQHKLFVVGGHLATETEVTKLNEASIIHEKDIERLEREIDQIDSLLPPLKQFILPRGSESASRAHLCRAICRRSERSIYHLNETNTIDENILIFINRLSDYFFLLARKLCIENGKELFWNKEA